MFGEHKLAQMQIGETAYTLPWGMWLDESQRFWLNPEYPASAGVDGTACMKVERRDDGYHVWQPADEQYEPTGMPGYIGQAGTQFIPVVQLHS